jgi:hypothetical protein
MFNQTSKYLSTQLDRVPVPPVGEGALPFALHSLEQPIHRRAMHRDGAVNPRELRCYPLLNLPDDLALGGLMLLGGYGGLHARTPFSFFISLVSFFLGSHRLVLLERCAAFSFPCETVLTVFYTGLPQTRVA